MGAGGEEQWATLDVPGWLFGGKPARYFPQADLKVRRSSQDSGGVWRVTTNEAYFGRRPSFIQVSKFEVVDGALSTASRRMASALVHGGVEASVLADAKQKVMKALNGNHASPLVGAAHFARVAVLGAVDSDELEKAIVEGVGRLSSLRIEGTDDPALPRVTAWSIRRSEALLHRLRYMNVLLRIRAEPELADGDVSGIERDLANGRPAFGSSDSLTNGVLMMDPYLGPLVASLTPSVWGVVGPRVNGSVLFAFGRPVAGTSGTPSSLLDTVGTLGPDRTYHAEPFSSEDAIPAAISWWAEGLNELFGWLTDPALFVDTAGVHDPLLQLETAASVEQVFRRMLSIQTQHQDRTSRTVLMFGLIDTFESLLRRQRLVLLSPKHAETTLTAVEARIVDSAAEVLLPAARRGVAALREVGQGFLLRDSDNLIPLGTSRPPVGENDAIAEYLSMLRNAVHGFGSDRKARHDIDAQLMIRHSGVLPHDLALLPWLYVLEILAHPERMRSIRSVRTVGAPASQRL